MIIALASPRVASSVDEALHKIERLLAEAAVGGRRSFASRRRTCLGCAGSTFRCRHSTGRAGAGTPCHRRRSHERTG